MQNVRGIEYTVVREYLKEHNMCPWSLGGTPYYKGWTTTAPAQSDTQENRGWPKISPVREGKERTCKKMEDQTIHFCPL